MKRDLHCVFDAYIDKVGDGLAKDELGHVVLHHAGLNNSHSVGYAKFLSHHGDSTKNIEHQQELGFG